MEFIVWNTEELSNDLLRIYYSHDVNTKFIEFGFEMSTAPSNS